MSTFDSRFVNALRALPPLVDCEWVGLRHALPADFAEDDGPAPDLVLWMELPQGELVSASLAEPGEAIGLAMAFDHATRMPGAGYPRRPRRVRVAEQAHADALTGLDPEVAVTVGPTPELDDVLAGMLEVLEDEPTPQGSFLAQGAVPEEDVEALFRAAAMLYASPGWSRLAGGELLAVSIPALDIDEACLWLPADNEGSAGLVLFPSLLDQELYLDALDALEDGDLVCDFGSPTLGLTFVRRDELPAAMRRETARHGWPVASAGAYPLVTCRNRFGVSQDLQAGDVRLLSACVTALSLFLDEHGEAMGEGWGVIRAGSYATGGLDVTLATVDLEGPEMEPDPFPDPVRRGPKIGRNDPCPCGSGRKYKHCCLPQDEAERRPPTRH